MDEKLTELLRSMSRYEDAEVTPDASFGADLGMNSFDFLQLLYAVEMTCAKHICLEDARNMTTVRDLMSAIST